MRYLTWITLFAVLLCCRPADAETLSPALQQLARDLAQVIDAAGLQRVGVPEFAGTGGKLDTGAAGHYVAERLEEHLTNAPGHRYAVVERRRLNTVLQEARVQASGLTDERSSREIVGKIQGLDALVVGSLARVGRTLHISGKIVRLPEAAVVAAKSAEVRLDADLLTLLGDSLLLPASEGAAGVAPVPARPQPQLDPACPYALEVLVNGRPKPLYRRGDDLLVGASRGEVYKLRLINRSRQTVGVALFIDGLSTIGAKREVPSAATKWVVRPGQSVEIPGWQVAKDHAREFVFVGLEESLAARERFTDEVGLITAAFYPEAAAQAPAPDEERRGGMGTGAGKRIDSGVTEVAFRAAATPAAILSLHYDAAPVVEQLTRVR